MFYFEQTQLMVLISNLCTGEATSSKSDIATLTAVFKQANVPSWIITGETGKMIHYILIRHVNEMMLIYM